MPASDLWTATDGGVLLAAAVLLPFVGMLLGLLLGGRWLPRVAVALLPLGLGLALAIAAAWADAAGPLVYLLDGAQYTEFAVKHELMHHMIDDPGHRDPRWDTCT